MLLGNRSVLLKSPGRWLGGPTVSGERQNWNNSSSSRAAFYPDQGVSDKTTSRPAGTEPPYSWFIAQKGGGLASHNNIVGNGSLSIDSLSMGTALAADTTGSGTISEANLALIVQFAADLVGSGTISAASLVGSVAMAAALAGAGDLAAALALIVSMDAALAGSGTAAGALRGTASMSADITVSGDLLTSTSVGPAVWQTLIEAGYSAQQLLRLLTAVVVNDATDLESDPAFKSIDGSKTRVSGTVAAGDRTITAIDPD